MKKIIFIIILSFSIVSCYPPCIVYAIGDVRPSAEVDSVEIILQKGNTVSLDAQTVLSMLSVEIRNNSKSGLTLHKSKLKAVAGSSTLNSTFVEHDSNVPCSLKSGEKKEVMLTFKTEDIDNLVYNNKKGHLLKLYVEFLDCNNRIINKEILLKVSKTVRFVYHK